MNADITVENRDLFRLRLARQIHVFRWRSSCWIWSRLRIDGWSRIFLVAFPFQVLFARHVQLVQFKVVNDVRLERIIDWDKNDLDSNEYIHLYKKPHGIEMDQELKVKFVR